MASRSSGFPLQGRHDADAVELLIRLRVDVKHLQQRRIEITALDHFVAARAGGHDARLHNDRRAADTAFVHRRLAAAQRRVAGRRRAVDFVVHVAAIVGGEHDDRVVGDVQSIQRVEQRADRVVHALDHRRVGRAALRIVGIDSLLVLVDQCLLGVERSVNAEHPVVQKERFVLVCFHERDGFFGHAIFDVLIGRVWIEVRELPRCDVTARRSGSGPMWHVDIESMLQRRVGLGAEMPFSEVTGRVAVVLEHLGQRVVAGVQPRDRIQRRGLLAWRTRLSGVAFSVTLGRWQFGVVMPVRAGLSPVRMADRVGEQSGLDE